MPTQVHTMKDYLVELEKEGNLTVDQLKVKNEIEVALINQETFSSYLSVVAAAGEYIEAVSPPTHHPCAYCLPCVVFF
jgi:hypothetical protein